MKAKNRMGSVRVYSIQFHHELKKYISNAYCNLASVFFVNSLRLIETMRIDTLVYNGIYESTRKAFSKLAEIKATHT